MPPVKLSKVTITPPKPKPTPVSDPLPGAPAGFDPAPPTDALPVDAPVEVGEPVEAGPPGGAPVDAPAQAPDAAGEAVGEAFAARARTAPGIVPDPEPDGEAEIPTDLVERLLRAVDLVPGLTLATALTLALEQFLATIPADYTRED